MLNVARNKFPDKLLLEASCDSIPLPDHSQQIVYAFHLLMHLNEQLLAAWSNEMKRIITPNGKWIVDAPTDFRRRLRPQKSGWHGAFSPPLNRFEELGWAIESIHPLLSLPIHRIPKRLRPWMLPLDQRISQIGPSALSSYQILVLRPV